MKGFSLVTGSAKKAEEYRSILPELQIETVSADVDEIQSLDLEEVARKKVRAVFAALNRPVVVDDTGFYLEEWKGLPGSLFKHFETTIGLDVAIRLLKGATSRRAYAKTCIAYFDGTEEFVVFGQVDGVVTEELRGPEGAFGFDYCFAPDGYGGKTYAELGKDVKNTMSHRYKALQAFKERFEKH
jgi:XTP/dITP diphosphohydrolase